MPPPPSWRLIVDGSAAGSWNMAVDEAILDAYAEDAAPAAPTVRLYGWSPPALSIGRGQELGGGGLDARVVPPGVDLVRRPTGGGAVLHADERTYSIAARLRTPPFDGGVLDTYDRIAVALAAAMSALGAPASVAPATGRGRAEAVCFERLSASEVAVDGRKLIGSAQLRRRGAFLQHGSIPLRSGATLLGRIAGRPVRGERFIDLESALGREVTEPEVDAALVAAIAARFAVRLEAGTLTTRERERARRYAAAKYGAAEWTARGVVGAA